MKKAHITVVGNGAYEGIYVNGTYCTVNENGIYMTLASIARRIPGMSVELIDSMQGDGDAWPHQIEDLPPPSPVTR